MRSTKISYNYLSYMLLKSNTLCAAGIRVKGGGGGTSLATGYSPLTSAYKVATFTPVVLTANDTFSFWVKGFTTSAAELYIVGSGGLARCTFRGSDGRFRFYDDLGVRVQATLTALNDGGEHFVTVRLDPTNTVVTVDNGVDITTSHTGTLTDTTMDAIAGRGASGPSTDIGCVYGVTLGGEASWVMQSEVEGEFEGVDHISGNDLIYLNDLDQPITTGDTIQTTALEDV